jgi:hypothetical protein
MVASSIASMLSIRRHDWVEYDTSRAGIDQPGGPPSVELRWANHDGNRLELRRVSAAPAE